MIDLRRKLWPRMPPKTSELFYCLSMWEEKSRTIPNELRWLCSQNSTISLQDGDRLFWVPLPTTPNNSQERVPLTHGFLLSIPNAVFITLSKLVFPSCQCHLMMTLPAGLFLASVTLLSCSPGVADCHAHLGCSKEQVQWGIWLFQELLDVSPWCWNSQISHIQNV